MAIQTEAQNAAAMNQVLRQATTLGLEGVQEASELITTQRDAELAQLDDYYTQSEALLREAGALKIRDGVMVTNPDGTTRPYTQEDLEREVQVLYEATQTIQMTDMRAQAPPYAPDTTVLRWPCLKPYGTTANLRAATKPCARSPMSTSERVC